jgi:hypothetical protein
MDEAKYAVLPIVGFIAHEGLSRAEIEAATAARLFPLGGSIESRPFAFTAYYGAEMGNNLIRWWARAAALADPAALPDWKNAARDLEDEWRGPEGGRRVNIDPGYLGLYQLVLATTKALPQAVYLRDGIFALVEFLFFKGSFQAFSWTYADYARAIPELNPWREDFLVLRRGRR